MLSSWTSSEVRNNCYIMEDGLVEGPVHLNAALLEVVIVAIVELPNFIVILQTG